MYHIAKNMIKNTYLNILLALHKRDIVSMSYDEVVELIKNVYTIKPFPPKTYEHHSTSAINYNLSIIVPGYNCEQTIEKCIDSLINQQTHYLYEIIIVNDGSNDNTEFICKKYISKDVRLITQNKRGGVGRARNFGLRKASGEYISFIDSDDYVEQDFVETMLNEAYIRNFDIVKCGYIVNRKGEADEVRLKDTAEYIGNLNSHIIEYDGYIWNMITKKYIWETIQFPEDYWYEDMITRLLVMRKAQKFIYINKALYHYCVNENSLSHSQLSMNEYRSIDHVWLLKEIIDRSEKFGVDIDFEQYQLVLSELGGLFYNRTISLELELRRAVFMIACCMTDVYRSKGFDEKLNNKVFRMLNRAFKERDFALWELVSLKG